jgi:hypothetical protein
MFDADIAAGVPDDLSQPLPTPTSTLTRARMPGGLKGLPSAGTSGHVHRFGWARGADPST